MMRSRAINTVGAAMCGTVLLVVLATKFLQGAGYAIAAMVVLFVVMMRIRRHYDQVRDELAVSEGDTKHQMLPSRGSTRADSRSGTTPPCRLKFSFDG